MTVFVFFVFLFFIAQRGTTLDEWRVRSEIRAIDVLELIEESEYFIFFYEALGKMNGFDEMQKLRESKVNNVSDANEKLTVMISKFMSLSYAYVMQLMKEFSEIVEIVILQAKFGGIPAGLTGNAIALNDNYKYCMITAFYDHGHDVRFLFESLYFYQTFYRNDDNSYEDLQFPVEIYGEIYTFNLSKSRGHPRLKEILYDTEEDFIQYRFRLKDIKQKITNFSNMFCAWWSPFVSYRQTTDTKLDFDRAKHSFLYNLFHNEECEITYTRVIHLRVWQTRISSWECKNILEPKADIYQKYYKKDETPTTASFESNKRKRDFIKEKSGADKSKKYYKVEAIPVPEKREPKNRDFRENLRLLVERPITEKYSLAELKNVLESEIFYLNVVKYYNIESEVMLLVSIREGNKMLDGVRHVTASYSTSNDKSVDKDVAGEMRRLGSTMSTFKYVFARLVGLMLEKKRIDVTGNPLKTAFDDLANSVVRLLGDPMNFNENTKSRNCQQIVQLLSCIEHNAYDFPTDLKFEEYFFTKPILNINQLYTFYVKIVWL